MDHQTFKNLDRPSILSLWKHGAFIDERTDNTYRYPALPVRRILCGRKWNWKTNIRHSQTYFLTSTEYLDIYLDKIDILVGHQPIG